MFVEGGYLGKINRRRQRNGSIGSTRPSPRPEYLVALKLHAAASPTRSKPEVDWEDIRQIVRICALDPERDESFRELILSYGGEDALAKIQSFGRRR